MTKNADKKLFRNTSKTYYYSTRFFPKRLRRDIARLYSFVRIADDYVEAVPAQSEKITELERQYQKALKVDHFDPTTHAWDDQDTRIIKNMMRLTQRYKFDPDWVPSFLEAMKSDLKPKTMPSLNASLEYVHGSAEVLGLMMAKIMKLPEETWEYARLQARAMQWINFVRNLKDDIAHGHQYFPDEDLKACGLADLSEDTARANPEAFKRFMNLQIKRFRDWQTEAEKGHEQVPKRFRIPVQTTVEMLNWTADTIANNPFIVYKKKVRPLSSRVLARGFRKKSKAFSKDAARRSKIIGKAAAHHGKSLYRLTREKIASQK